MTTAHLTNRATLQDAETIIQHQLHQRWSAPASAVAATPVMLWGAPGVGKSSVIQGVCNQEGIDFIDIRLAQRDPVDIRGLPVPKDDAVHWLLAADWPREPDSRGIILFDELTAADRSLQVAVYELILDRRLGSLYSLPEGWLICAAGNRDEDAAVTTGFSSALANRFLHLELEPQLTEWVRWAQARGVHPDIIAFLRFRPDCFLAMEGDLDRGWPSPRSWERVSGVLHAWRKGELAERTASLMIEGLVGPAAGGELLAFVAWHCELPDVEAMLRGEARVEIPERADMRYALCAAAVHTLWSGPNAGAETLVDGFFRLTETLTSDFATMAMVDALTGATEDETRQRAERLFQHPRFQQWAEQHGQAFAQAWQGVAA